ncbi:chromosome partition protein Smc [Marivirga tractuosa]|uniref:Chromosome partition protein Smc n=1 Tax=Marivirga tractuosa (strain ATCC 23168 / DSM 4126 / NBRC 15989 / NCIMB 1408 / VKM B-1430 / H-43) TaxID=643867 RepID=E4TVF1_MARTH|nr:chromosome segregation protein SMC [Marivirga tractuosa]ADR20083.1 chromosome segregation protein SMC [Marivirga tractuosa DSM 4126]BDD15484.1 chromosome partition protein Smc [Marivirga tractuosa]
MQLTKLEIKGFKSFGDRMVINFDKGITGIVGPNGCGKSNVVDAIRWVLGEQKSRMLRSDKMENVIFNGTKKRKQSNLAEVSLTFNNTKNLLPTEYSNVTITRRYYRTGESEYLLNGVSCRLKDITNLFMDTGISSNSYAIIELKMVDDILTDKDNSRRGLFEEAAGISKFKIRKKETIKKLSDTDADLERVEDLLFEIEKNLKSLEKQAKQAERYYQYKGEYKEKSILLAKKTVADKREVFLNLTKQVEAENDKKLSLNRQLAEQEAALEKGKSELLQKEKLLASRQKALNEHVNKIRQYESEKKIKNERLRFLQDKSDSLKNQIEQDKQSNERASFSIKSLEQEKTSAEKIFFETEQRVEVLKSEFEEQKNKTAAIREEVNTLNQQQKALQNEVYQLNKSLEIKEIQLSSVKQELEKSSTDTTEQSASLEEFDAKLEELSKILKEKNEYLSNLKHKEDHLNQQIEDHKNTIELIREELTQSSRKLDARENEYNLTKSLVDNLEGFPEAIKFLKKSSKWGKNAPLLSDVLTCSEDYRITIENFLEPYMNYYIVETEAQAFEAVNLLSDASKGKAHFFILDNFDKFKPSDSKLYDQAVAATEIVEYDAKYKKLIGFILDNVYVVKGDYNSIPDDKDSVFITQSGKVTKRKFSMSGGSVGLFEGKRIGRAKNLEKLQVEIKDLNKKISQIKESLESRQNDLDNLKEHSYRENIEILQTEINEVNSEYVSVRTKQEQFSQMLNSAANKREGMEQQRETLMEEIEAIKPDASKKSDKLKEIEQRLSIISEDLSVQDEILSQKSSAFNQENIEFHQQQNRVNSLEQEISYKQTAFESSKDRLEKNQLELKENEEAIKGIIDTAETNDDELLGMYDEKEQIEIGVNDVEKDYYAARGQIDEIEKESRNIQRNKEQVDELLMHIQNNLNETKLELNSVKERLSVEFDIDLDKIMNSQEEEVETDETADDLRNTVSKLKERMERIGPINPMAMEAYEEIKERNDFILTQREDLRNAKESLLNTITEIDEVARTNFIEAYEKIKENFQKVFRTLFTHEDECDLQLSDPDNPLESKIEIMAKPKGKRPLTINQLSGGEKTLTATSLLFAIYLLKPAPFCIFDEVDAPLDDANIDKFNNIIREFSKESQFIIVTHNKRTMSSTDVIYGVTMVELGISRVVPVDLRELEDTLEE